MKKKPYTYNNIVYTSEYTTGTYTMPARRDPSDKNQNGLLRGDCIFKQKNYTTWRDRCCTRVYYIIIVCVFNFEREKISTQIPFLVAQVTRTPKHVLNTLDGWRFSESDRKNVILGGDEGGGGGCGEGGCSSSSSSSSSRGGGR